MKYTLSHIIFTQKIQFYGKLKHKASCKVGGSGTVSV